MQSTHQKVTAAKQQVQPQIDEFCFVTRFFATVHASFSGCLCLKWRRDWWNVKLGIKGCIIWLVLVAKRTTIRWVCIYISQPPCGVHSWRTTRSLRWGRNSVWAIWLREGRIQLSKKLDRYTTLTNFFLALNYRSRGTTRILVDLSNRVFFDLDTFGILDL